MKIKFQMKQIFFLAIFASSLSCKLNPSNESKPVPLASVAQGHNNEIFGGWAMCASFAGGVMTQLNTCLSVTFNIDGTGTVTSSTTLKEYFNWTIKKNQLKIIYENKFADTVFPDTIYYTQFYKKQDLIHLTISHNNEAFYLSRSLPHP